MSATSAALLPRRARRRLPRSVRLASIAAGVLLALALATSVAALAGGAGISAPAEANPGSTITVAGHGFAAGQDGYLTYNGGPVTDFAASPTGNLSVPFTIPNAASPGSTGRISARDNAGHLLATTVLLIGLNDSPAATLTVPTQAAPGSTIDVSGAFFPPGQSGYVTINGLPVTTFLAAWDGSFDVPFAIPATSTIGTDRISAKDFSYSLIATTTIIVGAAGGTPGPTPGGSPQPTDTPAPPSQTPAPTATATQPPSDSPSPPTATETTSPPATNPPSAPASSPTPELSPTPPPSPTAGDTPTPGPSPTAPATIPAFSHVYVIVFENAEYSSIVGSGSAPYINSLIGRYGLATNFTAQGHPSEPNYIAMTSGGTQGVSDDGVYDLAVGNLFDQVAASGRTWRAYQQGYPGDCFTGASAPSVADGVGLPGGYVRRHDPAISYSSISGNQAACANITNLAAFDPAAANLEFITPNLINDMHDGTIADGDNFLKAFLPQIIGSPAFSNSVVFVTFDEGTTNVGGGGHVVTLAITANMTPGFAAGGAYTHYSMLRTIEQAWDLPFLGNAAPATPMAFPY
jgi:phosphatidylinositol-3-phosphatase